VIDGAFALSASPAWILKKPACSQTTNACIRLKRSLLPSNAPRLDPTQIMQTLSSLSNYINFAPWIAANAHNGAHVFVGLGQSMGNVARAPDDPLFWLHHCNVDRFFHIWLNCNGYDKVEPTLSKHYCSVNPTTTNIAQDQVTTTVNGVTQPVVYTLDSPATFYADNGKIPTFLPTPTTYADQATPRNLWFLGNATNPGWKGLHYRYGSDALASSVIAGAGVCVPGNTWTYVNYGATQKREVEDREPTYADQLYHNITQTFLELTEQGGMSPLEALEKMAMQACKAFPLVLSDSDKEILKSNGWSPSSFKRICDKDIKDD